MRAQSEPINPPDPVINTFLFDDDILSNITARKPLAVQSTLTPTRNGYRIALYCSLLGLVLRLAILFGTGLNHKHDRFEMISVAATFAHTGSLANAYMSMPTGPTAHVAPLYPILIGTLFRVFGEGEAGENIRQSLACAISSLRAGLLVLLVLALGLGEGTAIAAGLLGALYIGAFDTELKGDWEGPLAGVLLLALVLWGYRMIAQRTPGPRESLAHGAAWGTALLVTPSLALVLVGLAELAFVVRYRKDPRRMAVALLCCGLGVLAALSPWIVRNYVRLGGFVWGRDNFGLELSVSNGPGAHWSNPDNSRRIYSTHPSRYKPEAQKVAAMGEIAYNQERKEQAIHWIRDNPGEFARLTAQRAFHFWFPSGRNLAHFTALSILTSAAFVGLVILARRRSPAFAIVTVIWLSYPLLYYVIQWSSRYRLPIDWTLLLSAAVAVHAMWPAKSRMVMK